MGARSEGWRFCPLCGGGLVERDEGGEPRLGCDASSGGCGGFVHYDNPTPVVAAIVERGDEVLLVRNQGWPKDWFGLVSGFLERGESPAAGVLREVEEELGLAAEVVSLVGVYEFEMMNQVIIAYHVRAEGEAVAGEEIAEIKEVPTQRLRPWPFGTGAAVRDWLEAREAGS